MKLNLSYWGTAVVVGGWLAAASPALHADSVKFEQLEKQLVIDDTPLGEGPGVVTSYAPALEKVLPAVVTIKAETKVESTRNSQQEEMFRRMFPDIPEDFFERHGGGGSQSGLGSGVVISPDGYILTNHHVVSGADTLKVFFPTAKREYEAKIVGGDKDTDVAIIKIEAEGLTAAVIADSGKVRVGDVALAVGNPFGLEQTATYGIVSALGRSEVNITGGGFESFIQTDAAINRGNSGGALVDAQGRLIGINTAIQSNFSGGNIGIGFAIPSNLALTIVKQLMDNDGKVRRGFLGIVLDRVDAEFAKKLGRDNLSGVVVVEVRPSTPAEEAGFKAGDLIVSFNGKQVDSVQKLRLDISSTAPGTEVTFEVFRRDKVETIEATLGDLEEGLAAFGGGRPGAPAANREKTLVEGVVIKELEKDVRESLKLEDRIQGVLVESVKDNSPAAEAGLRPGSVITQIDQTDVKTVKEAFELVEGFEGDVLLLQVYSGGRPSIIAVRLK